jgi:heme/copper-type cytochrome/quinol oxidase subunit 3
MRYSNKDFLIAKHFEMKEKTSFKWGMICYLIKKIILFSTLLKISV